MRVLDATVTRRARGSGRVVGPDQRVDVITALKAMTIWPAYQHFEETTKGSLEPGKLADFVILSTDPTAVDPSTLADIEVTETVKEGVTVFRPSRTAGKTVSDVTGDSVGRLLHAMADPAHASLYGDASAPGMRQVAGMIAEAIPPGGDHVCQSDVMLWLADAMATGRGR
jgi:hypothetical protein